MEKERQRMMYPCDGIFPLIDTLGFIFGARRFFLLQKLHCVPLVLQLCLVTLPKLQEQRYCRPGSEQEMEKQHITSPIVFPHFLPDILFIGA